MRDEAAACVGLVKIYWSPTGEVHALKGIDAIFPAGALTAIAGPSGSGKSSWLRILGGLDPPTAGSVRIGGRELSGLGPRALRRLRRRLVGNVFQRPSDNLVPYLSAAAHLRHAARLRSPLRRTATMELLDAVGLGAYRDRLPHELSGGEQQRLAFAQAAIGAPAVLAADEPTSELDSASADGVMEVAADLARRGVAVVVATHDPLVMGRADRVLYLRQGALTAERERDVVLSVIDESGRVQLPPDLLRRFPSRRAVIRPEGEGVRIEPPEAR